MCRAHKSSLYVARASELLCIDFGIENMEFLEWFDLHSSTLLLLSHSMLVSVCGTCTKGDLVQF